MDIHEYQAKDLLRGFGIKVPSGGLADSPEQATYRAHEIGGDKWVVKAQVHTGGRGKAGGVKVCSTEHEVFDAADDMFGKKLVTSQSGPAGKIVYRVYVESGVKIERELYLGFVLDRSSERIMVVASSSGGMEIEEIAQDQPDTIIRSVVDPAVGLTEFQAREIVFKLGLGASHVQGAVTTIRGCYRAFRDLDATMVEINPLVVTSDNSVMALDAKMEFDDNALFRRQQIMELRDKSQEDLRETKAADQGLSYVGLDGNLGLFECDADTSAIVLIGEIGGPQEAEAAEFIRDRMRKPVIAYVAGLTAPKGKPMGHAGAIISAFGESAPEKVGLLREVGVSIVPNPSEIGAAVRSVHAKAA
jgi:succinyl-CoA synthetase beta subunit/malate-CoA ligase subunit beta